LNYFEIHRLAVEQIMIMVHQ